MKSPTRQSGMVIVVALFIVALVAAMAYAMVARLDRDTRRTTLILRNVEAENLAQGSIDWAIDALRNNWVNRAQNRPVDRIPITSPVIKENGFQIVSTIEDMQARYNVNNVTTKETQLEFAHLLQATVPTMPLPQAQAIAQALTSWIMPGGQSLSAADKYYIELPLPYRMAHRPLTSVSELRLIKGMTADIYQAVQPYVIALPTTTQLNAQTMSAQAMMTLNGMTLPVAKAIEQRRGAAAIPPTVQAFQNQDEVKNHKIDASKLTVISQYFLVQTKVSIEKQQTVIYTLLVRTIKENKPVITILWQSKGTW